MLWCGKLSVLMVKYNDFTWPISSSHTPYPLITHHIYPHHTPHIPSSHTKYPLITHQISPYHTPHIPSSHTKYPLITHQISPYHTPNIPSSHTTYPLITHHISPHHTPHVPSSPPPTDAVFAFSIKRYINSLPPQLQWLTTSCQLLFHCLQLCFQVFISVCLRVC